MAFIIIGLLVFGFPVLCFLAGCLGIVPHEEASKKQAD